MVETSCSAVPPSVPGTTDSEREQGGYRTFLQELCVAHNIPTLAGVKNSATPIKPAISA